MKHTNLRNGFNLRLFAALALAILAASGCASHTFSVTSDPVAAAKAAMAFAKDHEKFVVLGGAMGKTQLDAAGVAALATMPSLDELRANLLGLIVAPSTKIAQLVNAPAAKVARVISAYASKDAA